MDGITSQSVKPISLITNLGIITSLFSFPICKINFTSFILSTVLLISVLSHKFGWRSLLFTLSVVSKLARESGTFEFNLFYFGAVIFYFVILLILLFIINFIFFLIYLIKYLLLLNKLLFLINFCLYI